MILPWSVERGPRLALVATAVLCLARPATAQAPEGGAPVARDPALADTLFRSGVEALARGDYATACPKFQASMELDPAVSTLLNIAKCDLHDNKLAHAWATYERALVMNRGTVGAQRQKELDDYARKAIVALEPRVPRLRLTVTPAPPGLALRRDGESLPAGVLGESMPTDPGPHHLEISAPGYRTEARDVVVEEGHAETLAITLEVVTPPVVTPPIVTPPVVTPPIVTPPPIQSEPPPSGSIAPWVWAVGGLGVALAGVAVGFAADGAATVSKLHHDCPDVNGTPTCPQPLYGQTAVDALNARKNRDPVIAVGAGIAGGAALAVAVGGLARRGQKAQASGWRATPWMGPGTAGLGLSTSF